MAVAQKTGTKMEPLGSGNMDKNLRNLLCLILSHNHVSLGEGKPNSGRAEPRTSRERCEPRGVPGAAGGGGGPGAAALGAPAGPRGDAGLHPGGARGGVRGSGGRRAGGAVLVRGVE